MERSRNKLGAWRLNETKGAFFIVGINFAIEIQVGFKSQAINKYGRTNTDIGISSGAFRSSVAFLLLAVQNK